MKMEELRTRLERIEKNTTRLKQANVEMHIVDAQRMLDDIEWLQNELYRAWNRLDALRETND